MSVSQADADFLAKYGRMPPTKKKSLIQGDKKYFDSGDYALNKAGKGGSVGQEHPLPEGIPHSSGRVSPGKESGLAE